MSNIYSKSDVTMMINSYIFLRYKTYLIVELTSYNINLKSVKYQLPAVRPVR